MKNYQPPFGKSLGAWGACGCWPGGVWWPGSWWLQSALSAGWWAQPPPGGGPLSGRMWLPWQQEGALWLGGLLHDGWLLSPKWWRRCL